MRETERKTPGNRAKRILSSLFVQVLIAAAIGIAVGHFWPDFGSALKPIGDGFIRLIKMAIAPLIFCVVVVGICKAGDMRSVGRIGLKALIYFEVVTTAALALGLVAGNVLQPGAGLDIDPATLDASAVTEKTHGEQMPGPAEFVLHMIPESAVAAFAENELLQVLLFAVLFAAGLLHVGITRAPQVFAFVDQTGEIIFKIIGYVMRLAPIAVFGSMAYLIGEYGLSSLNTYAKLIAACYGAALLFCLVLGALLRAFTGLSLLRFLRYTREEFALAVGTASSEAVMPRIMEKLERAGCRKEAVGLVVPTGYSFNLDGASIYLSLATLFMAQAVGVDLTVGQQITVILVLVLTSKGMAGVPGSAFIALSATASAVGVIPVAAVALMLGADRFMDTMRVVTNLLGNCVATFIVSKWDGAFDRERAREALSAEVPAAREPDSDAAKL
ncbi:aerobic C4-dicarboxylate transport protein [Saccharopolyspora antimicrobica]|uniref:Aerobic C4-dicarboxylate transport protein n=1 Tax=Saccharopolyspora antimicrobica TaxID=455193 RepID=A0A1I5H3B2_9PSEU|nr:C4-dicarboxylate transporter DctA [Saccharopolyspora antimicrobica]RKT90114.1 aerobic C4-dicarboxylate transport protein [Saccharopolyspora antimicrobica]SFO42697.1 aerobic C4-dicarboxylate transport protein [Saccharopolyspora antimicrobica]